jgi:hypothetical protein
VVTMGITVFWDVMRCIYFLFFLSNDAGNNTDYTVSNDWMIVNNELEGM